MDLVIVARYETCNSSYWSFLGQLEGYYFFIVVVYQLSSLNVPQKIHELPMEEPLL
jgi:hypothetical protein